MLRNCPGMTKVFLLARSGQREVLSVQLRLLYLSLMRVLIALAATLLFGIPSPAQAQVTTENLLERLGALQSGSATEADCAAQLATATTLNAANLFYGAGVCYGAEQAVEGNFLIAAGQVRSLTDLSLMQPASEADQQAAGSLYLLVFYYFGGPGHEEVLREQASLASLFQMFDAWAPAYGDDYDPGWGAGVRPEAVAYQARLAESKAYRRSQLTAISDAFSDEQYYSLHREFVELQARNPRGFVEGTPDFELKTTTTAHERPRSGARYQLRPLIVPGN